MLLAVDAVPLLHRAQLLLLLLEVCLLVHLGGVVVLRGCGDSAHAGMVSRQMTGICALLGAFVCPWLLSCAPACHAAGAC
jgi:hypothetical protein